MIRNGQMHYLLRLPTDDPLHDGQAFIHRHDQIAAATTHEIARAIADAKNAEDSVVRPIVFANGSLQ